LNLEKRNGNRSGFFPDSTATEKEKTPELYSLGCERTVKKPTWILFRIGFFRFLVICCLPQRDIFALQK